MSNRCVLIERKKGNKGSEKFDEYFFQIILFTSIKKCIYFTERSERIWASCPTFISNAFLDRWWRSRYIYSLGRQILCNYFLSFLPFSSSFKKFFNKFLHLGFFFFDGLQKCKWNTIKCPYRLSFSFKIYRNKGFNVFIR